MSTAYETARAALAELNGRRRALIAPRYIDFCDAAGVANLLGYTAAAEAHSAAIKAIHAEATAAGFIRIFDGSYKLDLKKIGGAA